MAAEAFTAGVGSQAFTGAILGAFMAGVSGTFTAIAFSVVIVSSFPVSMGTRGGGIGVILIIGVTHIIRIIRITLTSSQITRARTSLRRVLRRSVLTNWWCPLFPAHFIHAKGVRSSAQAEV